MNRSLAKISDVVRNGIRHSGCLRSAKLSGMAVGSLTDQFTFPGQMYTTSMENQSSPTDAEIDSRLREWHAMVNTEDLTDLEKRIHENHSQAVQGRKEVYDDPVTGFQVYTIYGHLKRGACCGNACRHCPYEHQEVASRYKLVKRYNGAFFS